MLRQSLLRHRPFSTAVVHSTVVTGVVVAALVACRAGDTTLDDTRLERAIQDHLTQQGVPTDSVDCPEDQPKKSGHKFDCKVKAHGTTLHMTVAVTDDKGSVTFTPRDHTFKTDAVAKEVQSLLEKKGHKVSKVDCHGKVWVATKDAKHTCDVTDEQGTRYRYTAVFSGDGGKHTAKLEKQ